MNRWGLSRQILPRFKYRKEVIRGSVKAFTIQISGAAAGFLLNVVVARVLDPSGYGEYAYAISWANILAVFACLGLDSSTLRFAPAYQVNGEWSKLRGLVRWTATSVLMLGVFCTCLMEIVFYLTGLGPGDATTARISMLLVPLLGLLTLGQALLRSFKELSAALLPNNLLRPLGATLLIVLMMMLIGRNVTATEVLWLVLVATAAAAGYQYWTILRRLRTLPHVAELEFMPRQWIAVALPLLVMSGLFTLLSQLDLIMLGSLGEARDTGFYSAAMRFATLASLGLTASNVVVAPLISEFYYGGRHGDLRSMVHAVTLVVGAASLGVFVVFLAFGREFLAIFGRDYAIAYYPCLMLLGAQVINAATGPSGYLLFLTGRHNLAVVIYGTACVINFVINVVAIPRLGMYGAALATLVSLSLANMVLLYLTRRFVLRPAGMDTVTHGKTGNVGNDGKGNNEGEVHMDALTHAFSAHPGLRIPRHPDYCEGKVPWGGQWPDFFIIGAPKCGTTALATYLDSHADLSISVPKEPCFFAIDFPGLRWTRNMHHYRSLFRSEIPEVRHYGDASVWYLYSREAVGQIHAYNRQARLLVLLRHPADMVYSLYWQYRYDPIEDQEDFARAWELSASRKKGKNLPVLCHTPAMLFYDEVARYASQLERVYRYFPREQVGVFLYDDMVADIEGWYRRILAFLSVETAPATKLAHINVRKSARSNYAQHRLRHTFNLLHAFRMNVQYRWGFDLSYLRLHRPLTKWIVRMNLGEHSIPPLSPDLRREIVGHYREETERLAGLIGRDLSAWLQ